MKKSYKAIIVDDERLARNDLKNMLVNYDNIEIVSETEDVNGTIDIIDQLKPDVIFLDIQMPGESGFDLFDRINVSSKVIFVTAYDEYAIRAFEVNALDYLLKPVHPGRLARSIAKLELAEESQQDPDRELDYDDRLFITIDNHMVFLNLKKIICIIAAGDYSEIVTADGKKGLVLKSMKAWEKRLPEKYFIRIHRSTIINMEYMDHLEDWFNYSYRVHLKGLKTPLVMSRRYGMKLKHLLG